MVELPTLPEAEVQCFARLLGVRRWAIAIEAAEAVRKAVGNGTLWHVNSTASGGGVAEILHTLVPLYRRLGVRTKWAVVEGDPEFFAVTKRLGNLTYGSTADDDALGTHDRRVYDRTLAVEGVALSELVGANDTVLLHDHQTAGLAESLAGAHRAVYWRCHVGSDHPNAGTEEAWDFLLRRLASVNGLVFSTARHVPEEAAGYAAYVLPPVIWPLAPKNRELSPAEMRAALAASAGAGDGSGAWVAHLCAKNDEPAILQVSRWDRLKDMHGVLDGFVRAGLDTARLILAGPDPEAIPDDIEQEYWYRVCRDRWDALPVATRERVALLRLPMSDPARNALMVNALQRSVPLVVQKSLAEGFGLTVTEAMWKGTPVLAASVGGIVDQVRHGRTGLLVDDPTDADGFASALRSACEDRATLTALGARGRTEVLDRFLLDRDLRGTAAILHAQSPTKEKELP